MSLKTDHHFSVHIVKAKDLPLTWYELILRPDKFSEHLETLAKDPAAAPSAAHLMVTFLEKAGIFSVFSNPELSFKDVMEGDHARKLVQCALLVASSIHWDSAQLWLMLPLSVQYCLVSLLRLQYPLPEEGVVGCEVNTERLTAHVIYSEWVLRFVIRQYYSAKIPTRATMHMWEMTCVPADKITDMVRFGVKEALTFLLSYLEKVDTLTDKDLSPLCPVPRTCVELQMPPGGGGGLVCLESVPKKEGQGMSFSAFLSKVRYTLGCHHLVTSEFQQALQQFTKTQQLLETDRDCRTVDRGELQGYLEACKSILHGLDQQREVGGGGKLNESLSSVGVFELHFRAKDYEAMEAVLVKDMCGKDMISCSTVLSLELDVDDLPVDISPEPKRIRSDCSSSISPREKLVLCGALKKVLQGNPPYPRLWRILGQDNESIHLDYLLKLCDELFKEGLTPNKKMFLWSFMRSTCSSNEKWWHKLLLSRAAKKMAKSEDLKDAFGPKLTAGSGESMDHTHNHVSSTEHLERKVGLATCPREVLEVVDDFCSALPASQLPALVTKWVGSTKGYLQTDAMLDHVILIKYNCLLHRAHSMTKFQLYHCSLELYTAALSLFRSANCQNTKIKQKLEEYLQEHMLMAELKAFHMSGHSQEKSHASMFAKARAYYMAAQHWATHEWETWSVVGAFLLNMEDFQFLSQQESKGQHVPSVLPYRLAEVVIIIKEGRDLRKSIRSLFETVLQVFSPPLYTNEIKAEVNERQVKMRSNLDLFIKNLTEPTSLALLIAGLARIWNLLKKPDDDIITEFSGHWPTAIGNAASIDAAHVLRMLNTTLGHALQLSPHSTSWILSRANTHIALCEYGAALEDYMEAAAISTNHFHDPISERVWSSAILRRLINCCLKLNYHTQAAILCQLLQPADYELVFRILRENACSMLDNMFQYFWDMTIIEYLIYVHSKKPDSCRHVAAVEVASQADLNFHNSTEVLNRAAEVRRRKFLRTFYSQITHAM